LKKIKKAINLFGIAQCNEDKERIVIVNLNELIKKDVDMSPQNLPV